MSLAARRLRKPVAPTEADLKVLRRLVKRARQLAAAPLDEVLRLRLQKTADHAWKARLPIGHQGRDSEFLKIINLGKVWWRLSPADREAQSEALGRHADACREVLDGENGQRQRADIHG